MLVSKMECCCEMSSDTLDGRIVGNIGKSCFLGRIGLQILLCITVIFSAARSDVASAQEPWQLIQELGFQELNMKARDFTLNDLNGRPSSLSDYRGQWVWLVFWATWCSACAQEMPLLESLCKLKRWRYDGSRDFD